jgi:hypothetical protein
LEVRSKEIITFTVTIIIYWYILAYNPNKMHKSQSLFNLTTALHVSSVTITHLQEHKTTVATASGKRYTVIELNLLKKSTDRLD